MSLLEWLLAFTVVVLGLWLVSVMPSRRHEELEIELNKLRDTNETHWAMVLHRDDRIEQLWKCVQQLDRDIEQYKTASLEYERLAGERAEEIRKLKSERDKFSNAMVQAKRCLTVEISSRDVMNSGKSVEVVSEDVLRTILGGVGDGSNACGAGGGGAAVGCVGGACGGSDSGGVAAGQ